MSKCVSFFIILVLALTSCMGKEKMGFNTRDKMNMQTADKIVECINMGDVDALYDLFSENCKVNEISLKGDIRKLYKYLNGKVTTYEKWAVGSTTGIEKEKNSTYYYSSFKMVIKEIEYYLYYIYYPEDDFNIKNEGLKSLRIIKVNDDDKYFCYWQEMKPGVFLPDAAKQNADSN